MRNFALLSLASVICIASGCNTTPRPIYRPRTEQAIEILALEQPISFENVGFVNGLAVLRKVYGLNIYADWQVLELMGVNGGLKVNVSGVMTIEHALLSMLGQVSTELPSNEVVGLMIVDGVVVVSIASQLDPRGFSPYHPAPENEASYRSQLKYATIVGMTKEEESLVAMLAYFEVATKVPFVIDWQALISLGISKDMKVNLNIGQLRADMALHLMIRGINRDLREKKDGLGYIIIDGKMHISNQAGLDALIRKYNLFPTVMKQNKK